MKAQVITNYEIVRETEKAILVSTDMLVGSNIKRRDVWMPKSQTKKIDEGLAFATWIIAKNEDLKYRTFFNSMLRHDGVGRIMTINV